MQARRKTAPTWLSDVMFQLVLLGPASHLIESNKQTNKQTNRQTDNTYTQLHNTRILSPIRVFYCSHTTAQSYLPTAFLITHGRRSTSGHLRCRLRGRDGASGCIILLIDIALNPSLAPNCLQLVWFRYGWCSGGRGTYCSCGAQASYLIT